MSNKDYNALLSVRTSSSRLPRKCFLPFGDSNTLIHVVKRSINFGINPIVCTSTDGSDDEIEELCQQNKILYFRGSLENKLNRWLECATKFQLVDFHTIDVDDPFFDPLQVKESIDVLREKNLDIVSPTEISSNGSASVGYSIKNHCLIENQKIINGIMQIEMIDSVFNQFNNLKHEILVSQFPDFSNVRLTLDYIEDYYLLVFVLNELGPFCNREEIGELFRKNPDLYKFNWFRNLEWSANQTLIRTRQGVA
jgi:spore coat polysaccharide biosynthesis protein SpsF